MHNIPEGEGNNWKKLVVSFSMKLPNYFARILFTLCLAVLAQFQQSFT